MRANILLAIVLIIIGVAALGYQGFSYTTREKVVDVGPLTVMSDKTSTIPLPPIVGVVALVSGAALLFFGRKDI